MQELEKCKEKSTIFASFFNSMISTIMILLRYITDPHIKKKKKEKDDEINKL